MVCRLAAHVDADGHHALRESKESLRDGHRPIDRLA
jgi:hypothetical protein